MSEEEIATSQVRHFITFLEGKQQDGSPWSCQLTVIPTGGSDTLPDSFWTQLLANLQDGLTIVLGGEQAFSPENPPSERKSLWRRLFGRPRNSSHEDTEWVS